MLLVNVNMKTKNKKFKDPVFEKIFKKAKKSQCIVIKDRTDCYYISDLDPEHDEETKNITFVLQPGDLIIDVPEIDILLHKDKKDIKLKGYIDIIVTDIKTKNIVWQKGETKTIHLVGRMDATYVPAYRPHYAIKSESFDELLEDEVT